MDNTIDTSRSTFYEIDGRVIEVRPTDYAFMRAWIGLQGRTAPRRDIDVLVEFIQHYLDVAGARRTKVVRCERARRTTLLWQRLCRLLSLMQHLVKHFAFGLVLSVVFYVVSRLWWYG